MNIDEFDFQWKRLKGRFGDKALDDEFKKLCSLEVADMEASDFRESVNVWIGERHHTKPPLLIDFRTARVIRAKKSFTNDVNAASTKWENLKTGKEAAHHLANALEKEYGPGIRTVKEAFEFARLKEQIKNAEEESKAAEAKARANVEDSDVLEF